MSDQYHPLQSFRHLTNRIASFRKERDTRLQRLVQIEEALLKLQAEATAIRAEDALRKHQVEIFKKEAQALAPRLRGFPRTHEACLAIIISAVNTI